MYWSLLYLEVEDRASMNTVMPSLSQHIGLHEEM